VTTSHHIRASHNAEILVCTAGNAGSLTMGQAAVLRNGEAVSLAGNGTVFRVWGTR